MLQSFFGLLKLNKNKYTSNNMDTDFTFDDFKEAEETPQYINDSISNVFEKERTAVECI